MRLKEATHCHSYAIVQWIPLTGLGDVADVSVECNVLRRYNDEKVGCSLTNIYHVLSQMVLDSLENVSMKGLHNVQSCVKFSKQIMFNEESRNTVL